MSTIAGSRLRDGNPSITDLSDDNRPIAIAEKFSELYDNEWTDAFENLKDSRTEEDIIQLLLDILRVLRKQIRHSSICLALCHFL